MGDIALLYLSLFIAIFFGLGDEFKWKWVYPHLLPFSILYLFWLIVFYIFGLYDLHLVRKRPAFYTKVIGAISVNLVLGMIFFYLFPFFGIAPKTNLFLSALIFVLLFLAWRRVFYALFSSHFLNKVAIIGNDSQRLAEEIIKRPYLGYKLINLNSEEDLLSQIKKNGIDTLIMPPDLTLDSQLIQNLYQCLPARINFIDWAQAYELICNKIPISFITHAWFLENLREGEKTLYDKTKRALDMILAGLILIITLPLWPFISLAIKADSKGPVIYRQQRVGKDRKLFSLLKFRSMKTGAENKSGPVWAKKEDPRATKVGRLLRQTHLDELPQMINILKGEVSLVGPRPERPEFVVELEKEIPHYHIRHLIRPGFTGWAQLRFRYGRSIMDSKEKFQYDLYYLKNRSLLLDLGILLKTFQLFFKKD